MTYVRRKHSIHKPKDILGLSLRNLWLGDELICTSRTYDAIRGRVNEFSRSHQDKRLATITCGSIMKIRRVA